MRPVNEDALNRQLVRLGLDAWIEPLNAAIANRLTDASHGDFDRWQATLDHLEATPTVNSQQLRDLLLSLAPWRKGPFDVAGVHIDSEWRSLCKWNRLKDAIAPLADRSVLDVGSGNGYYALRMQEAGARFVLGIDPTILYVMQFAAVTIFEPTDRVFVLPMRMQELPDAAAAFDTCFSMGVLYHRRSPIDHLLQLKHALRPGGQLVLETLFLPGNTAFARTPQDRYARMRNVWMLPTVPELLLWLQRAGFRSANVVDQTVTTTDEQRSTEWMPFESLQQSLDPDDANLTVEGWPSPRRVVITANKPG